jgi:hypothetical protein
MRGCFNLATHWCGLPNVRVIRVVKQTLSVIPVIVAGPEAVLFELHAVVRVVRAVMIPISLETISLEVVAPIVAWCRLERWRRRERRIRWRMHNLVPHRHKLTQECCSTAQRAVSCGIDRVGVHCGNLNAVNPRIAAMVLDGPAIMATTI